MRAGNNSFGQTELMLSVARGENPIDILIKPDAPDLNAVDSDGRSALFWAQHASNYDAMCTLLRCGADKNIKDRWGVTILGYAAECADLEAVKMLIEFKADVNAKDRHGTTVLMNAVQSKNIETVKLLVEAGADVTAVDTASWDLPLYSRRCGTPEIENYINKCLEISERGRSNY